MNRRQRIVGCAIALLLLGGGTFHVSMMALYHAPPSLAKLSLGAFARGYMQPLFSQNWHLFSPNPGISYTALAVRCRPSGEGWGEWVDPVAPLEAEHDALPFTGLSKLLYVYRGVGRSLETRMKKHLSDCLAAHQRATAQGEDEAAQPAEASPACTYETVMDEVYESAEFGLALTYSHHVCEALYGVDLDALQFKLVEFFPLQYSERHLRSAERPWGKVIETVFPEIEGE